MERSFNKREEVEDILSRMRALQKNKNYTFKFGFGEELRAMGDTVDVGQLTKEDLEEFHGYIDCIDSKANQIRHIFVFEGTTNKPFRVDMVVPEH